MTGIADLLAVARAYATAEHLALATVSDRVFRDGKKLAALEDGIADIQTRRAEKAMQWFSDNWPPRTPWPKRVARPTQTAAAVAQ